MARKPYIPPVTTDAKSGLPIVRLRRPRCPKCKALNKSPYRSETSEDGELVEQRRHCKTCGLRFITIAD